MSAFDCQRCESEVITTERHRKFMFGVLLTEIEKFNLDTDKIVSMTEPNDKNPLETRYRLERKINSNTDIIRVLDDYRTALSDAVAAVVYRTCCTHNSREE